MPVDFGPLTGPVADNGTTKGLAAFGDALEAVLQRRALMQRQQQEIEAQRQAAALVDQRAREFEVNRRKDDAAQQARIATNEKAQRAHEAQQLDMQRQQRQAEIMGKVPDMIAKGQSAGVPGLLGAAGVNVSQKPVPEELQRQVQNPMLDVSNLPFAGMMDVTGGGAQVADRARQQQVKGYDNKAVLDFGGGRTADLDMAAMGPEARAEMMRKALDSLPSDNPFVTQAKTAIPVLTGGGMIKPGDENNIYRDATKEAAALERAKLAADAARNRATTEKPGQKADDARADISLVSQLYNVKQSKVEKGAFDEMTKIGSLAASGKNAIAAQAFKGMWSKYAQGGAGVLSDRDLKTFWEDAGSPNEKAEDVLAKWLSGGLGEPKRQKALEAVAGLRSAVDARLKEAYEGAAVVMEKHGDLGDQWLRGIFGKGLPSRERERTADKAKALLDGSGF